MHSKVCLGIIVVNISWGGVFEESDRRTSQELESERRNRNGISSFEIEKLPPRNLNIAFECCNVQPCSFFAPFCLPTNSFEQDDISFVVLVPQMQSSKYNCYRPICRHPHK